MWGGGCGEVGVGMVVRSCGCGVVRLRRWVWGGGCGCVEVGVGVGMENPTPVQNVTYLEPDSIISSLFVQSVIAVWSAKQIGGFGGVCVGVVVRRCRCDEVCVWGGVCEVNVGRWSGFWVVRWVWGGGCRSG